MEWQTRVVKEIFYRWEITLFYPSMVYEHTEGNRTSALEVLLTQKVAKSSVGKQLMINAFLQKVLRVKLKKIKEYIKTAES